MINVPSLTLTAALYGLQAAHVSASCPPGEFQVPGSDPAVCRPGCYPVYADGKYTVGDPVSATVEVDVPATTEDCTGTSNGCVDGSRPVPATTMNVKYNFKCISDSWCGQSGFAPGSQFESQGWDREEPCEGTAPLSDFIPDEWTEGGCPSAYVAGGDDYDAGAIVSVDKGTYSMVYQCTSEPNNQFCNDIGYEPGSGQYWSNAWTELGSCSGSLSPTESPNFDVLQDLGGCPDEWEERSGEDKYQEGDRIQVNGIVFECKPWPESGHCSQDGYVPFNGDASTADAWKDAWFVAGYCNGSMGPTESPSFDVLEDMGACPDEWEQGREFPAPGHYEEGDTIQVNGIVFKCRPYPWSGHCGQDGYVPFNGDAATADAWKDAWTIAGYCSGTMGPTQSPSFDVLEDMGACPDEWEAGREFPLDGHYEEGDMIQVNSIVFKCKAEPYGRHCGQDGYVPFNEDASTPDAWKMAWTIAGYCQGTMGPTQSPSFDELELVVGGCPDEYSSANAKNYGYGTQVALTVSDTPGRKIVFECKPWPEGDHCVKDGTNAPGEEYGSMGWITKGYCMGTKVPTMAPTQYTGICTYTKTEVESCSRDAPAKNANPGSTACSCTDDNTESVIYCRQTTVTYPDVDNWSSSVKYATGDVARVGRQRYKCKVGGPSGGWCSQAAYEPEVGQYWTEAWSEDGMCEYKKTSQPTSAVTTSRRKLRGAPASAPASAPAPAW